MKFVRTRTRRIDVADIRALGLLALVGMAVAVPASCNRGLHSSGLSGGETPRPGHASTDMMPPGVNEMAPRDYAGLHNVVAFAEHLFSGGAPDGADGFDTLASLGVRTIISVDGAQPDVDAARARGLRYVHLPIGYDGMDRSRTLEIARAVEELPGPIYIHCHHGKHRSAGASGAAAVTLGLLTNDAALQRMSVSGTSPKYVGLYECVAIASTASHQEILAASHVFPERWKTTGLVRSMVEVDKVFEHLERIQAAAWNSPAMHPDLVPAAEAGRMADLLRNLQDDERCRSKPVEFLDWMRAASMDAARIESELLADPPSRDHLEAHWRRLVASCTQCHAKYRD